MLTMTQAHDIRKAYFEEGMTLSAVAAKHHVDRKTVRKYLDREDFNAPPPPAAPKALRWPKLEPYRKEIDEWLEGDRSARRKQRHTAKRVYERLRELHPDFPCSYRTVASYVTVKKKGLYSSARAALPLEHRAGEAQVDFGNADFYENGTLCSGKYLNVSFPYSNAGYLQLFKGENRECLFEGLKAIFERVGGVPPRLWFDNMSTVVAHVLKEGKRELCDAFLRFKEHHGFEAAFCNPNAGHEKGNVENKVGYHRRNLLVPLPRFESLAQFNEELFRLSEEDHRREHYRKNSTIAALHQEDKARLRPLPQVEFDCSSYETVKTDAWGKFRLSGTHTYSTSPRHAGARVLVRLSAHQVIPLDENHRPVAVHQRLYGAWNQEAMDWLPYLTQLSRHPNALKYSGIWTMLPEELRTYLDGKDKSGQKDVLKTLAFLSERDGFVRAVKSVAEAVHRGVEDMDSLVALHNHLHSVHPKDRMEIDNPGLPRLPEVRFSPDIYDSLLPGSERPPC